MTGTQEKKREGGRRVKRGREAGFSRWPKRWPKEGKNNTTLRNILHLKKAKEAGTAINVYGWREV